MPAREPEGPDVGGRADAVMEDDERRFSEARSRGIDDLEMQRAARTIELAVHLADGTRGSRARQGAGRLAGRCDPQALGFRRPPRVVRLPRFVRLLLA